MRSGLWLAACLTLGASTAGAEKLQLTSPFWADDAAGHLVISAGLAGGGYAIAAAYVTESRPLRALIGAGASLLISNAKEVVDLVGPGVADWRDVAWNAIGAAVGTVVSLAIDWLLTRCRPKQSRVELAGLREVNL